MANSVYCNLCCKSRTATSVAKCCPFLVGPGFAPGYPPLQPSVAVWGSFSISRAGALRPAGPFYVAYLGRDPHETPCARTALCALALQEKGSSGRGNVAPVFPHARLRGLRLQVRGVPKGSAIFSVLQHVRVHDWEFVQTFGLVR